MKQCDSWKTQEPGSSEFVSALAAGMRSKLIVEVTSGVSPSTIALAAAARQTGGRLVCILPEPVLLESKRVIKDLGLKDLVEFRTGDPSELLHNYENIDFSLVDCKNDDYTRFLKCLDVNPKRSVVVANNLVGEKKGLQGHLRGMKDKVVVRSLKNPIGKGMEVTMIGKKEEIDKKNWVGGGARSGMAIRSASMKGTCKSKWVVKVDEESGEEHIFRVPNSI
jgi:predicted O-methyltransferase YrrM